MHFLYSKHHFLCLATASDMSFILLLSFLLLIDIEHFSTPMQNRKAREREGEGETSNLKKKKSSKSMKY